jgi:hypothetical protein
MATVNNNKIKFSGFTTKQKIQLPSDDPLVDILKSQYYDLVITAQLDGSVILSLPASNPGKPITTIGENIVDPDAKDPTVSKDPFPSLSDIVLKNIEIYNDIDKNSKIRFTFSVKNNNPDLVRGAKGVGG